jgi:hypothetical protein
MQGFFVEANGAMPSLTIPATSKTHSGTSFYKNTLNSQVQLKVENNNGWDITTIGLNENATTAYDLAYDVHKMKGSNIPQIYSIVNGQELSTNVFNINDTLTNVQLAFIPNADGIYNLRVLGMENLNLDRNNIVSLIDIKEGKTIDLKNDTTYQFNAEISDDPARFALQIAAPTSVNNINNGNISIYSFDKNVYVSGNERIKSVSLINMTGIEVTTVYTNEQSASVKAPLTGCYLIKVVTEKSTTVSKVFVK